MSLATDPTLRNGNYSDSSSVNGSQAFFSQCSSPQDIMRAWLFVIHKAIT